MKALLLSVATVALLAGCTSNPAHDEYVDNLTECEKIQALLQSYDQQFAPLKRARTQSRYMDSWDARYDLIGDQCQIAALDATTVNYSCTASFKDKETALSKQYEANAFTRQCLGEGWLEQQKESEQSLRTTFVKDENSPTVSVHTGKSLSKRTPWTTSYEVGKSVY